MRIQITIAAIAIAVTAAGLYVREWKLGIERAAVAEHELAQARRAAAVAAQALADEVRAHTQTIAASDSALARADSAEAAYRRERASIGRRPAPVAAGDAARTAAAATPHPDSVMVSWAFVEAADQLAKEHSDLKEKLIAERQAADNRFKAYEAVIETKDAQLAAYEALLDNHRKVGTVTKVAVGLIAVATIVIVASQ